MAKHMEKTIQKSIKAANGEIKNIDELMNILNFTNRGYGNWGNTILKKMGTPIPFLEVLPR